MSDFKVMAIEAALKTLFAKSYFSICTVDSIIKTLNLKPDSDRYNELHLLHCVDYGDMSPALLEALPTKLMQLFDCPRIDANRINVVQDGGQLRLVSPSNPAK